MADDSYATIGLSGPAATSDIDFAEDPTLVEDDTQAISPFFITDGSTNLLANTSIGAAYFVLSTSGNSYPDANLRVKIMQITTTGDISGTLNYQIFPLGVGADKIYFTVNFDGTGTFVAVPASTPGCTDAAACNYDSSATEDDESCVYPEETYLNCDGSLYQRC